MTMSDPDLRDWIGRRETRDDVAVAAPAAGLAATLDLAEAGFEPGAPLPPAWHWLYFTPRARRSELGPDGHPARGGFMPPVRLPRRMFAAARMTFAGPVPVGAAIRREGEVIDVSRKTGTSGPLVFVRVRYRISADGRPAVEEEQTIVYREPAAPGSSPAPARDEARGPVEWRRRVVPDPVLLFRFSALTFNAHRIHYDRPYATEEEGYPGLVVHGPLTALLLLQLCRDETGGRPVAEFGFRARRPLFDIAPFDLVGRMDGDGAGATLEALDPQGAVAMTAMVRFADR